MLREFPEVIIHEMQCKALPKFLVVNKRKHLKERLWEDSVAVSADFPITSSDTKVSEVRVQLILLFA